VAESTNANHSDPGKRTDIMLDDRIEHGYSSAEQRPSGTMIDILRYGRRPYPMATNVGALRIAGGERIHFAPPMTQELERQVAESTNANHSDPGKRTDINAPCRPTSLRKIRTA